MLLDVQKRAQSRSGVAQEPTVEKQQGPGLLSALSESELLTPFSSAAVRQMQRGGESVPTRGKPVVQKAGRSQDACSAEG